MKKKSKFLLTLICAIASAGSMFAQAQWGVNLLQNPSPDTETQFTGWTKSDNGSWAIKEGYVQSSNQESVLTQTVDLAEKGFSADDLAQAKLLVSVRYEIIKYGREGNGICQAMVVCLNDEDTPIDTIYAVNKKERFDATDVPPTTAIAISSLPAGVSKLRYELHGKDHMFWAGNYGPRFTDMGMELHLTGSGTYSASVDPALGDSIALSKTTGIALGDTITVTAKYAGHPILSLSTNTPQQIEGNKIICCGSDMVVSAYLAQPHAIITNVDHGTLTAAPASAIVGDTITLSHTLDDGYAFDRYFTTPDVQWIDGNRFIMPDEDVTIRWALIYAHTVPFFEGFEEDNIQSTDVVGWWQESEFGNKNWQANSTETSKNRQPYAGQWNATLVYSNTDWLFTKITLEAGKQYIFSMYARQDGAKAKNANISVYLGNAPKKSAMTTEIIPETGLVNGNYQGLVARFSVSETQEYILGIRGKINNNPFYISIDNIRITERQPHIVTCVSPEAGMFSADLTTAYAVDTVTLSAIISDGYVLSRYITTPAVKWIDDNRFVMPDEDVTIRMETAPFYTVPFFEGFEENNQQGRPVAGWLQQSISGDSVWTANSTLTNYNRTPFAGNWNVTLWADNTDWMFKYFALEAGKEYRLSLYARQYATSSGAYLQAGIGSTAINDSMKVAIIPSSPVKSGAYQLFTGTFTVPEGGIYALGIQGRGESSNHLSIDDIRLTENVPHTIQTTNPELGTITLNKTQAMCGDTIRLSRTMAEGELFVRYTTNTTLLWLNDSCFRMPDEDVIIGMTVLPTHSLPFFEGFEEDNTDQEAPKGWLQQSEAGGSVWIANSTQTDKNRQPYNGKWNVTLRYNNTDWLFTKLQLEADTEYEMYLFARQDGSNKSYATLRAALGNAADKDSMKIEILPETGLTNGDYQQLHCRFSVPASGKYILGIRGKLTSNPMYMSIDDIHIQKRMPHAIRTANPEYGTLTINKTEAYVGDTISVEYAMNDGFYFRAFTTTPSVKWIDAKRFIMIGEDVTIGIDAIAPHAIPFFDGFEEGNTQDRPIAGWVVQNTYGSDCWKANTEYTNYNRAPYAGNWNVTLRSNNRCYMFNALALEAGKEYLLSFRARQDKSGTSDAYVAAYLGSACHKDSMKIRLMNNQYLVNGDYQPVVVRFSVKTSGNYVLGIYGYITYSPAYMSIDNVRVVECTEQYTVTTAASESGSLTVSANTAYPCDTITVRRTMNDGYAFCRYNTNIPVRWLTDSTFVMPDENVNIEMTTSQAKPIPFFDGFEENNQHQQSVAEWFVTASNADNYWRADNTRTPYEGTWTAYFSAYENNSWMFNAITLEAGKTYTVSMRAKQTVSETKSTAQTLQVCLGNTCNEKAMTTVLVPQTIVRNTLYQTIVADFTVPQTATYVLGIRGYASSGNGIVLDNVRITEKSNTQYAIAVADSVFGSPVVPSSAAMGDTIAVSRTIDPEYVFISYSTDKTVRWIDKRHFIMPDEAVTVSMQALKAKTIPFFDGFEEGNTDQKTVAGWLQYSENGSDVWRANSTKTDRNRTPYEGQWNVTLSYGNTDWLMQAFRFEKRKAYKVSLYARQDYSSKSYANISICLGSELNNDSLTIQLIPQTGITNGDYQLSETTFTVPATASYALGIRGFISGTPYCLSIDNITIEKIPVEEVTPHVSATSLDLPGADEAAVRTALAALTLTAVDAKDSVVYTYTNMAEKWVIDMMLRDASYTLTSAELPVGYIFANDTETVHVALANIGTGVGNATVNTLQVYPNPATDYIHVAGAAGYIAIYDLAGNAVLTLPAEGNTAINISMLPAGMYMLRSADMVAPLIVK